MGKCHVDELGICNLTHIYPRGTHARRAEGSAQDVLSDGSCYIYSYLMYQTECNFFYHVNGVKIVSVAVKLHDVAVALGRTTSNQCGYI